MNIISFSDKPSPFEPVSMEKIAAELAKKAVLEVRKNKQQEKATK
ncbi:hypothetical protein [Paenibacillus alkalitolerans]|nr:hypothetical protein [Paenibacillus alkalitolerans]